MMQTKRSPYAKSLRSPHLRQQVIPDKRQRVFNKGDTKMRGEDEYVEIEVEIRQDRPLSVMVYAGDDDEETGKEKWISIPKSQMQDYTPGEGVFKIPSWLCEEKGLEGCVI